MKITSAKPLPGYKLELRYATGETGIVDLSEYAGHGVLAIWQQPGIFEQVVVTPQGSVEWPGEVDLCPDALYLRMTGKRPEEIFLLSRGA